jgi:thymidylate synthase (FAD)
MSKDNAMVRFQVTREPVLDHGFVELLDLMGDDKAIEDAARVSYGEGTRKVNETRGLIRYLLRHKHTSPFEAIEIKLRVKLPIFVERQWARHRTAHWNEISARYSELPEEYYVPDYDQICYQSTDNKQGRSGPVEPEVAASFEADLINGCDTAFTHYHLALNEGGIARETARIGLPLGTYTEKIWKIDGKNLLGFLALRCDHHAQWEIRQYANVIAKIVEVWCPLLWQAFVDYWLEAVTVSRMELGILREIVGEWAALHTPGANKLATGDYEKDRFDPAVPRSLMQRLFMKHGVETTRERAEFLKTFGITVVDPE